MAANFGESPAPTKRGADQLLASRQTRDLLSAAKGARPLLLPVALRNSERGGATSLAPAWPGASCNFPGFRYSGRGKVRALCTKCTTVGSRQNPHTADVVSVS